MRSIISRRKISAVLSGVLGSFLALMISGCAGLETYNSATGRNEFIMIPTKSEVRMGQGMHGQILSQYPLAANDPRRAKVEQIGARLAQISDRQDYEYHFYLLNKDELNAFTTPGGNIYVFTGLLSKLKTDDELAAVLAHEIGHCAARHTIKKFQAATGYNIIGTLLFSAVTADAQAKKIAAMGTDAVMNVVFSAYSRGDELEADRLGIKYLDLAGFKVQGMVDTLEVLAKEEQRGGTPLFLRSHPYAKDRVIAAKEEIRKFPQGRGGR